MTSTICRETAGLTAPATANYAWVIDRDHLDDGQDSEVGVSGPSTASNVLLVQLKQRGAGTKFRMRDDDGILYYEGRILIDGDEDGEELFGPLEDFGMPNAGCTEIQYRNNDGEWVGL